MDWHRGQDNAAMPAVERIEYRLENIRTGEVVGVTYQTAEVAERMNWARAELGEDVRLVPTSEMYAWCQ